MLKLILIAIVLDWIIGDPPTWPHPVRFYGAWIKRLEIMARKLFRNLYIGGFFVWAFALALPLLMLYLMNLYLPTMAMTIINTYVLFTCLAAKCMKDEAFKVKRLLLSDSLEASQRELGYLVGRDTANLTKPQVLRGIIETVSENTVDGILAPLFYMLLGAPFGLSVYFAVAYKVVNTLDSMIGYMQAPYREIGCVSAKVDDVLNYIPARLGAFMMLIAGALLRYNAKQGFQIMMRDRRNHKSPNCGYPEATTAGLLNIQLGGTNTYFGEIVIKPTLGDAVEPLDVVHIDRSISILYASEAVLCGFALLLMTLLEVL